MKRAVVDVACDCLAEAARVMTDAGLRISGSMSHGFGEGTVRLIIEDEVEGYLPDECIGGWWLVRPLFTLESYGTQRLTRLTKVDCIGRLVFSPNGESRLETPPTAPDSTMSEAALARKAAILGRIAEPA